MRKLIGKTGVAVCLATAIASTGCGAVTSGSEKVTRPYYTADSDDYIHSWIDCVAQTDDRVNSDDVKITMVEAKYFAVTEKYGCKLVAACGKRFNFVIKLPHGKTQQFVIDGAHMAEGFAIVANDFDKNEYVKQWEKAAEKYSDVPDSAELAEDAEYYQGTLKKISNELKEAEKQPDIGLISLRFFGRYATDVDSRSLSYDVEQMVKKNQSDKTEESTEVAESIATESDAETSEERADVASYTITSDELSLEEEELDGRNN